MNDPKYMIQIVYKEICYTKIFFVLLLLLFARRHSLVFFSIIYVSVW